MPLGLGFVLTIDCLSISHYSVAPGWAVLCPPLLFVLALVPLFNLIRHSWLVKGLRVGSLKEKISLCTNNALLYLQGADASLKAALDLFNEFVNYSGIRIN